MDAVRMMTLPRREFLSFLASVAGLSVSPRLASAQVYPLRPVQLIVGYAAGGINDVIARLTGQWLSGRLQQQFVIENRPGAGGNIGTELVVRSAPDGYTLFLAGASNAIGATLYDNLNFNFLRDLAPVAGIMRVPLVMVVHPSVPATSVAAFIAYAKANPGKISMASAGTGNTTHVAGELFKMMAGVDMVHVAYRGDAPALADLIGGRVQVMFGSVAATVEFIRSGKLRALAVTSTVPAAALPDLPTVAATVPGYEASGWFGIVTPRRTPQDVISRLNDAINAGLADAALKARIADLSGVPLPGSPEDFGRLIASETAKWAQVIRTANIKAE